MLKSKFWVALALGLSAAAAAPCRADYDLTFETDSTATVGGSAVGAKAEFIGSGTTLTIILTDTSATATKGQLLSGVFFDISGVTAPSTATYATPDAKVTAGSKLFTDATHSTTSTTGSLIDVTGAFVLKEISSGLGTANSQTFNQQFGLSATGDSPIFPNGQFTKGGAGDDYGIVGPGTDLTLNTFKNSFPLIQNSVTFTITNFNIGSGITNVTFPFGSAPNGNATGHIRAVPEPASLASIAVGGLMAAGWHRRMRRRAKAA